MYIKTPGGSRYHLASCSMVKNVSEKITLAVAQKSGLTPCLICRPASGNAPGLIKQHRAKPQQYSAMVLPRPATTAFTKQVLAMASATSFNRDDVVRIKMIPI